MIPYGRQQITSDDVEAVLDTLQSDFLTQGPQVPAFEQALAHYCEVPYAVVCNNGTAALHLACLAADVSHTSLVWVSAISFVASANCARYCGAEVDFVDVDPETGNISIQALRDKIARAKCPPNVLIIVHLAGQPCELFEIHSICKQYGITLIEDACHALGARYLDSKIGECRYSDMTVFSFHPVKAITTGEGGAITTRTHELAKRLQLYRGHGITRDSADFKNDAPGDWYYEQHELGYNYRLTDIQATLGISQLKRLDSYISTRRQKANYYNQQLNGIGICPLLQIPNVYHAFHLYVVRVGQGRNTLLKNLRDKGIMANFHYQPIPSQPYYKALGQIPTDYPGALIYGDTALSLPLFPTITIQEQDEVIDVLKQLL
ncbi:UDP-4-amino-4,6-dideoxy-N-acetyl-beta-L-altrosamine transaminase [Aeromonas allosaccharophila]|uniref:UDP-4-amino-4, 6-dideoxy-N-acetyl-beta-L-altrosamine transaminase n=1 Tax=Aeromonas allosaccharophila TaxID=656 RepID=UPI0036DB617C